MPDHLVTLQNMFQSIDNCELALRKKKIEANTQRMAIQYADNLDKSIKEVRGVLVAFKVTPPKTPLALRHRKIAPKSRNLRLLVKSQPHQQLKIGAEIKEKFYPLWMTRKMASDPKQYAEYHKRMSTRLKECQHSIESLAILPERWARVIGERNAVRAAFLSELQEEVAYQTDAALEDIGNQA